MASQKPEADQSAEKTKVMHKKNQDKVIKRPARGYHKHRNGFLNVKPKGSEKEIVKANQKSPLLRLPAEIRISIWQYVLGDNFLLAERIAMRKYKLKPSGVQAPNTMALLRTCRQVYAETASMPLRLSTFTFRSIASIKSLSHLRSTQRRYITKVQVECNLTDFVRGFHRGILFKTYLSGFFQYLSGLKFFKICIFKAPLETAGDNPITTMTLDLRSVHFTFDIQDRNFAPAAKDIGQNLQLDGISLHSDGESPSVYEESFRAALKSMLKEDT